MSWKFPDSNLLPTEVVTSEGLNDGFVPAATEAQGRINEHNLSANFITSTTFGSAPNAFIPDTHVSAEATCLEYVNTRGTSQTAVEGGTGATRGAWVCLDNVAGHNQSSDKPELDGAIKIEMSPLYSTLGPKSPPFQRPATEVLPRPMLVSFFVGVETSVWVMATMQVMDGGIGGELRGSMFALRVNGAIVVESIFGTGDLQNDRIGQQNVAVNVPSGEILSASPAANANGLNAGYPVCVECVVDVPPGQVTVEVVGVNAISLSGEIIQNINDRICVGSREIVILKMMR
jgi:hypothetical protein